MPTFPQGAPFAAIPAPRRVVRKIEQDQVVTYPVNTELSLSPIASLAGVPGSSAATGVRQPRLAARP
jgi:hypothetical protein